MEVIKLQNQTLPSNYKHLHLQRLLFSPPSLSLGDSFLGYGSSLHTSGTLIQQLLPFFPSMFNMSKLIYFIFKKKKKEKERRCTLGPIVLSSDQLRFFSAQPNFLKSGYFLSSHVFSMHCSHCILGKVPSDFLLLKFSEHISCLRGSSCRMNFPWFQRYPAPF